MIVESSKRREAPLQLTRDGIRKMCESTDLKSEFKSVYMAFQVIDVTLFDQTSENSTTAQRKGIKGKI